MNERSGEESLTWWTGAAWPQYCGVSCTSWSGPSRCLWWPLGRDTDETCRFISLEEHATCNGLRRPPGTNRCVSTHPHCRQMVNGKWTAFILRFDPYRFTILSNIHPFMRTFTHRRKDMQSHSQLAGAEIRCLAQGHFRHWARRSRASI